MLNHSNIDQQTAGSSRLLKDDYENNPTLNYTPISYREVRATRLSVAYEQESGDSLLSITPYVRDNFMELLPNWSLSYDPTVYETSNRSAGLLAKYRQDFAPWNTRLIVGLDLDYSPGDRDEWIIDPVKDGNIYTDYTLGDLIYDYDVSYSSVAPYVHVETSPVERLRLNAGLRFDWASFDYDNKLGELQTGKHRRPAAPRWISPISAPSSARPISSRPTSAASPPTATASACPPKASCFARDSPSTRWTSTRSRWTASRSACAARPSPRSTTSYPPTT